MSQIEKLLEGARQNPEGVLFADAIRLAKHYFGEPRIKGSHHIFVSDTGLAANLQPRKDGKAKGYQIDQLLASIDEYLKGER
jgi:hypothetical protein